MTHVSDFPSIRPSLMLDFANTKRLDPRITFSRPTTATYYDANGVLKTASAGVARFDHNPVTGESKGLLIEEQRTNLLTYSEQFDNASWVKTAAANIQANQVVAPDGTLTGDKFFVSSEQALSANLITQQVTAAGATYTLSVYAKRGELNRATLNFRDAASGSNQCVITFSLVDGSVALTGSASGTFTFVGSSSTAVGNSWYRFSLTCTTVGTAVQGRFWASDSVAVNGDGTSGIYIWGAQLEAGAFATSYIPTTSAQVTRSADSASMTGTNFSSWYRADEGSIYANWILGGGKSAACVYEIAGATIADTIRLRYGTSATSNDCAVLVNNVGPSLSSSQQLTLYTEYENAMAYKVNDFARATATQILTASSGSIPIVTTLSIGSKYNGTLDFLNGHIKKLAYYPKRLTNTELQTMTA